jgi:phosphotransacetylase
MKQISEIYTALKSLRPRCVAVAAAQDEEVLLAVISLYRRKIIRTRLFGDSEKIRNLLDMHGKVLRTMVSPAAVMTRNRRGWRWRRSPREGPIYS